MLCNIGQKSSTLTYHTFISRSRWGWSRWNFAENVGIRKVSRIPGLSYGVICVILGLAIFVELRIVTDRQTDRQTHGDSI